MARPGSRFMVGGSLAPRSPLVPRHHLLSRGPPEAEAEAEPVGSPLRDRPDQCSG